MSDTKGYTRGSYWAIRKRECDAFLAELDRRLRTYDPTADELRTKDGWKQVEAEIMREGELAE